MNNKRRKTLGKIQERLEVIREELEFISCEEQECFDNLPEGFQYSERGERLEENVYTIETAMDGVTEVIDSIQETIE